MSKKRKIVTIDGPSGVGKSTISRRLAAQLKFTYLDTGAMYRSVALKCKQLNLDFTDERVMEGVLERINLRFEPAPSPDADVLVFLDDIEVTTDIRTPEISMLASKVSAMAAVRNKLTVLQQQMGAAGNVVVEGRDTGTVVFPDAAYKFYLDAAPEERASRRILQLRAGKMLVDEQKILEQIIKRDNDDQQRTIAPLKKANDAKLIDTTGIDIDQVLALMLNYID
ncbi:MAG: (d)CMP kinase [Desulfobulbaceae bacterium]|nr:(d)CMP kinase [Desulfobulbaceae bacterium]